jgi:lipopolysaccharide export LptBFGC system permease protein LptF
MSVNIRGYDVIVEADEDPAAHETFPRSINIPMPPALLDIEKNDIPYYLHNKAADKAEQEGMRNAYNKLISGVRSEMHSRASFAVSCFILVMVGCALGMISRSGNFLSAFAVSVAPALLCIALIVTGQHVCENSPKSMGLGLSLIWSGNVIVFALAAILLGRLHRT